MLIKDDAFAKLVMGKQVVFGMAEPYETFLLDIVVNDKEPAYVVSGVINDAGRLEGVVKPWTTLLMEYKRRGSDNSSIYELFPTLINNMELIFLNEKIYSVSRLNTNMFTITGADLVAFVNIEDGTLNCSGKGDLSVLSTIEWDRFCKDGVIAC